MAQVPVSSTYNAQQRGQLPYATGHPYVANPYATSVNSMGTGAVVPAQSMASASTMSSSGVGIVPGQLYAAAPTPLYAQQYGHPQFVLQPQYVSAPGYGPAGGVYSLSHQVGSHQVGQQQFMAHSAAGMSTRSGQHHHQQHHHQQHHHQQQQQQQQQGKPKKQNAPKATAATATATASSAASAQESGPRKLALPTGWSPTPFRSTSYRPHKKGCCTIS